jgi:hypothetical protein
MYPYLIHICLDKMGWGAVASLHANVLPQAPEYKHFPSIDKKVMLCAFNAMHLISLAFSAEAILTTLSNKFVYTNLTIFFPVSLGVSLLSYGCSRLGYFKEEGKGLDHKFWIFMNVVNLVASSAAFILLAPHLKGYMVNNKLSFALNITVLALDALIKMNILYKEATGQNV